MEAITVTEKVNGTVEKIWDMWTLPEHITNWAFASDDWECPDAENDIVTDGRFKTVMRAKDGSASFDFTGTYTLVDPYKRIEYTMDGDDARKVTILFEQEGEHTKITETFDPENINPAEMQRSGWQSILVNFKNYVETH